MQAASPPPSGPATPARWRPPFLPGTLTRLAPGQARGAIQGSGDLPPPAPDDLAAPGSRNLPGSRNGSFSHDSVPAPRPEAGPSGAGGRRDEIRQQLQDRRIDFSADVREEMRQLWSFNSNESESRQETRFGGHEAVPEQVMEAIMAPSAHITTNFTQMPGPRRVSSKTKLPGETPWRAFCQGTAVILVLWTSSTLWCLGKMILGNGWDAKPNPKPDLQGGLPTALLTADVANVWDVCATDGELPMMHLVHAGRIEVGTRAFAVGDAGCGLRRPVTDTALACRQRGGPEGCVAALLRRGGRQVTLCKVRRRGRRLVMERAASLRTMPGAPPLHRLAAGWEQQAMAGSLKELRLYGRSVNGALLALRPGSAVRLGDRGEAPYGGSLQTLVPLFELEQTPMNNIVTVLGVGADRLASFTSAKEAARKELLVVSHGALLSIGSLTGIAKSPIRTAKQGGLKLSAWDLATGTEASHSLAAGTKLRRYLTGDLGAVCAGQAGKVTVP